MWTYLLPTLLLLQSIAVQAQSLPPAKFAQFTQIICPSITGSRQNQLAIYDKDHNSLATYTETCSILPISKCNLQGLSDVTLAQYTVMHPNAFFGYCEYKDLEVKISVTEGSQTETQVLYARCGSTPFPCEGTSTDLGTINQVIMREFPSTHQPTSIFLKEYNQDGCPADQNFGDEISNSAGCVPLTNTGSTHVVVVPKPDMPSSCVLTLYADASCFAPTQLNIGPITPGSDPGSCIGPIWDLGERKFEAKSAMLNC